MKLNLILILISLSFSSCFPKDYESAKIKSPTGNFDIQATVNKTDKKSDNYADVIIHVFNNTNEEISKLNTKAGDFSKWAIGWTEYGDTIILQSSDIGNSAWVLQDNKITKIEITPKLNKRAEYIKLSKYK